MSTDGAATLERPRGLAARYYSENSVRHLQGLLLASLGDTA